MQGRLTEHPLVETLRELTAETWTGALRLSQERVKAVCYFERGKLVYVAANLKQYRLADNLRRAGKISDAQLAQAQGDQVPDLKLAQTLLEKKLVPRAEIEKVFSWQAQEMLQMALNWSDGTWQVEARVQPAAKFELTVPLTDMILPAARKIPPPFIESRFAPAVQTVTLTGDAWQHAALTPQEGFLATRIFGSMSVNELLTVCGLPADEARKSLYVLVVSGLVACDGWPSALAATVAAPAPAPVSEIVSAAEEEARARRELESFFALLELAQDHYQLLQLERDAAPHLIKESYYRLARKFHPDRYRSAEPEVRRRLESGFTLATRAYEVLKDENQRARYTAKLPPEFEPLLTGPAAPHAPPAETPIVPEPAPPPVVRPPFVPPKPVPVVQPQVETPPLPVNRPGSRPVTASPILPPPVQTPPPAAPATPPPLIPVAVPLSPAQQRRATDQFQRGLAALASGDFVAAIVCLAEAVRLVPHQASYHAYFGRALSSDPHSRRQAEAEVSVALQIEPHNIEYRFILAEVYWNIGFPLRAQGEIARVLERDPFHRDARTLRDKMNADSGKK